MNGPPRARRTGSAASAASLRDGKPGRADHRRSPSFWSAVIPALMVIATVLTAAPETPPRGGRVAWGRLVTSGNSWTVHGGNDAMLAAFIHEHTSLNIDPTCYPANPAKLDDLCQYPLIFTNNLTNVHDPQQLANIREFFRRGGFLYIDRCVNLNFSLPQEEFYERHVALFHQLLPEAQIREIRPDHPLYNCYFPASDLTEALHLYRREPGHNGVYGVYLGGRMIALLSLANFQCGWPNSPPKANSSMKMIANIYVYAMTRTGDEASSTP